MTDEWDKLKERIELDTNAVQERLLDAVEKAKNDQVLKAIIKIHEDLKSIEDRLTAIEDSEKED